MSNNIKYIRVVDKSSDCWYNIGDEYFVYNNNTELPYAIYILLRPPSREKFWVRKKDIIEVNEISKYKVKSKDNNLNIDLDKLMEI